MYSSSQHRQHTTAIMMVLLSLVPVAAVAADDDYLSILEAEAADTGNTTTAVERPTRRSVKPGKYVTPDLDFEAFEEELRSRYAGTHLLYMKLSAAKRRAAWKFYRQDNALSSLREHIVSVMSSS